jgi:hypothetical protein
MSTIDDNNQSVFRPEAVLRYREGQETTVLPRTATPRMFAVWWLLLAVLLLGLLVVWLLAQSALQGSVV